MAEIKPFKALRFTKKAGLPEQLCCPPYDIISEQQRRDYIKRNANNIIRLELPGTNEDSYDKAGAILKSWLDDGIVAVDEKPALYIYSESFTVKGKEYSFKGFICRVKLEEFSAGVVLPHEETLSKAKTDRFNLMCATGCNFSQVYSLYRDPKCETGSLLNELTSGEPDVKFTDDDGVTHRLWTVTDEAVIDTVAKQFEDRKLYIADGHHRYETALNYRRHMRISSYNIPDSNYVMMFLADLADPGLVVFPTHRIVRDLESFDEEALLSAVKENFTVEECKKEDIENLLASAYEKNEKAFGFVGKKHTCIITLKDIAAADARNPEKSEALRRLDVTVLHSLILEDLLKIDRENMANQINLKYSRDFCEAADSINDGANCAFILNPTRVSEISDVAAAGEKMPQKSTYFYPKLITGLVMNQFYDLF